MGPLLFNVFIHDLFYYIGNSLYNFADDNTLSKRHRDVSVLTRELCDDGTKTLIWFDVNFMQANPQKFQGFAITSNDVVTLSLNDVNISIEEDGV